MAKGRPPDPTRRRRQTGHRPLAGEGKKTATAVLPAKTLDKRAARDDDGLPVTFAPPDDLPEPVAKIWRTAVAELHPRGLREADLEIIRQMCHAAHRARQAAENIQTYGLLVDTPRGLVINPMARIEKDATSTYLRLADAMGLTIGARLRLGLLQVMGESIIGTLNRDLDTR